MDSRRIIPENSRLRHKSVGFSFFYYIWFFLSLSLVGWLWKVCLYLVTEFLLAALLCSAVEYACGWFLEKLWGIRWWDYSDYFMNLNGRICLLGAVVFGVGALILIYLFIPWFEKLYEMLTPSIRKVAGLVLLLLFLADAAYAAASPNLGSGISAPVPRSHSDTA